jgi:hypothetical protein
MEGLLTLAQDIGASLGWILALLCYVGGASTMLGGFYGLLTRAEQQNGLLVRGFVPELMIVTGAVFLSFPEVLNVGNQTVGGTMIASFGGNPTPVQLSASQLTTAVSQGPAAVLTQIFAMFKYYFAAYGALIVYFAFLRQLGRAKGANHSSTGLNIVMACGGFAVMNADLIGPAIIRELGLIS